MQRESTDETHGAYLWCVGRPRRQCGAWCVVMRRGASGTRMAVAVQWCCVWLEGHSHLTHFEHSMASLVPPHLISSRFPQQRSASHPSSPQSSVLGSTTRSPGHLSRIRETGLLGAFTHVYTRSIWRSVDHLSVVEWARVCVRAARTCYPRRTRPDSRRNRGASGAGSAVAAAAAGNRAARYRSGRSLCYSSLLFRNPYPAGCRMYSSHTTLPSCSCRFQRRTRTCCTYRRVCPRS